jgi:hypothetical protein
MKKLVFIFLVAVASSGTTFAQKKSAKKSKKVVAKTESVAPAVVKDSFKQNFAGTEATWTKNYGGHFVGTFTKDEVKTAAEFDKDGKWLATRTNYTAANLPQTVATGIKAKYPAATIKDGLKIERSDIAAYYKVNIQDGGTEKVVLMNEAGTIAE